MFHSTPFSAPCGGARQVAGPAATWPNAPAWRGMRYGFIVWLLALLIAAPPAALAQATVVDVDKDATSGANTGSSWPAINTATFSGSQPTGHVDAAFTPTCSAAITVQNTNDAGAGSLRQAIADVCPGGTIAFDASLSGQTVTLASTLPLAKNLTLDGSSLPVPVTLNGNEAVRIFRVMTDKRVTLDSLILTRGRSPSTKECPDVVGTLYPCGGALKVESGAAVTLTRSLIADNRASGEFAGGGGIANYGTVNITGTIFADNVAEFGGAILSVGSLQVAHSSFTGNAATRYDGGAISSDGILTVSHSAFIGNAATTGGGAISHGNYTIPGALAITFSTFTSNTATDDGGAIAMSDSGIFQPPLSGQIADSTFSGNQVLGGIPSLEPRGGGAISFGGNLSILRSTFHGNVSATQGGALSGSMSETGYVTVTQSVFTDNRAGQWGGAASLAHTGALVQNSLFVGNQVTNSTAIPGHPGYFLGYGGGLYIDTWTNTLYGLLPVRVENTTVSGNVAARMGGGLFINAGPVHLTHVTVADNGAPAGAGIYVGSQLGSDRTSELYYTDTLVAHNLLGNGGLRGADCVLKLGSSVVANVNNLVEDGSCGANGVGFLSGDPLLGPLTDLGGPRVGVNRDVPLLVRPLRAGSPALDSVPVPSATLPTDQRGLARPQGSAPDRGAYERGPLHLTLTATPAPAPLGGLVTFTLVLYNDDAAVLDSSVRLTATLPAGLTFERWGVAPPDGVTSTANGFYWRGSLPAHSSLGWVFEARNTGAFNQPGEYGDALLAAAAVSGATDPGNWTDVTVVVECDSDPLSVDNLHNAGPCSLRQILNDAPAGATITFRPELAGQTIWVAYPKPFSFLPPRNATLVITHTLTVDGSSLTPPVTLDGNDESRILLITDSARATLDSLTLTHGRISTVEQGIATCGGAVPVGGAILVYPAAALTLTHSTVISNTAASQGYGAGGGIANVGRLTVLSSTIADNFAAGQNASSCGSGRPPCAGGGLANCTAAASALIADSIITGNLVLNNGGMGGGIFNYEGMLTVTRSLITGNRITGVNFGGGAGLANTNGTLVVNDSTFTNNTAVYTPTASFEGGGILTTKSAVIQNSTFSGNQAGRGGAITAYNALTLMHSTLTGNFATYSGGEGGLRMLNNLSAFNNIIANNTPGVGGVECTVSAPPMRNVNNLVGDGSCSVNGVGFLSGAPRLGPLSDYGGPRIGPRADTPLPTHALLPGSPAIDAGDAATCLAADQRGVARPTDGNGDGAATCDIGAYETVTMLCGVTQGSAYTFDDQSGVSISIASLGSELACLYVVEVAGNHPQATSPLQTGRYWIIRGLQSDKQTDASGFSVNLTLPTTFTPDADDKVCRYPGGLGGAGWDCAADSHTANTITRNGITAFSDWTVGNNSGPTALRLRGLRAHPAVEAGGWLLLGLALLTGGGGVLLRKRFAAR